MILPPHPGGIFIEAKNIPIDFVVLRASSIPAYVRDPRSNLLAGITGSDIVWESGLGKEYGEEIPIYEINESAKQSSLYVGVNTELTERFTKIEDLDKQTVVTKYPNITRELGVERGVNLNVMEVSGTDEAIQYAYPYIPAILGIISSGDTVRANGIKILEVFYKVVIKLIEVPGKATAREITIIDDFRELIAVAVQKRSKKNFEDRKIDLKELIWGEFGDTKTTVSANKTY